VKARAALQPGVERGACVDRSVPAPFPPHPCRPRLPPGPLLPSPSLPYCTLPWPLSPLYPHSLPRLLPRHLPPQPHTHPSPVAPSLLHSLDLSRASFASTPTLTLTPCSYPLQDRVDQVYRDQARWTRMSIMSTAGSGFFSSDRTIAEVGLACLCVVPVRIVCVCVCVCICGVGGWVGGWGHRGPRCRLRFCDERESVAAVSGGLCRCTRRAAVPRRAGQAQAARCLWQPMRRRASAASSLFWLVTVQRAHNLHRPVCSRSTTATSGSRSHALCPPRLSEDPQAHLAAAAGCPRASQTGGGLGPRPRRAQILPARHSGRSVPSLASIPQRPPNERPTFRCSGHFPTKAEEGATPQSLHYPCLALRCSLPTVLSLFLSAPFC
jgi:hypothetical protein